MAGSRSALLVMDVQAGIVDAHLETGLLDHLATAIAGARDNDIPVIYVVVGFRPGYAEVSARNKMFGAITESGRMTDVGRDTVPEQVAPHDGEPLVVKKRVSAFAGSDLDLVLRAGEIDELVLTGISTSGVVLSTTRAAADLDFKLTVLSDCVADRDEEVQRVLLEKVLSRQAEVMSAEQWVGSLG